MSPCFVLLMMMGCQVITGHIYIPVNGDMGQQGRFVWLPSNRNIVETINRMVKDDSDNDAKALERLFDANYNERLLK